MASSQTVRRYVPQACCCQFPALPRHPPAARSQWLQPHPCPCSLPSEHIRVFARGDGSGTTVLLTCYLRKGCPQQWSQEAANRLDWPAGVNVVS
jgi:hypothetical protein